jgi:4-hydroxy-3-methylbut-2-enyl diphosphate reductase
MAMKVTLADALGTCFGVEDAITEAMDPKFRGNLTIIGQLVHNPQVVQALRENGVEIVDSVNAEISTPNVMITAHGAAKSVHERALNRGFKVFDATCPLVMKVHKSIARLEAEGFFPVVIGQESHVEVRGIVTDLKNYAVISDENDFYKIKDKPKIGIVSQTTNQIRSVLAIVEKIKALPNADGSAKDVRFVDTVCKPTKDRQTAVEKLAGEVDLMIVVGGYNSSNTKKLKKVCDDRGLASFHIESPAQLEEAWFKGVKHVGITAGTSTPAHIIDEVYQQIVMIGKKLEPETSSISTQTLSV